MMFAIMIGLFVSALFILIWTNEIARGIRHLPALFKRGRIRWILGLFYGKKKKTRAMPVANMKGVRYNVWLYGSVDAAMCQGCGKRHKTRRMSLISCN